MIKIFLVCKSDTFFRTIESILNESGIFIENVCKSPGDALPILKKSNADVILLDVNWSSQGMEGLNILSGLLNHDPLLNVILVTTFFEEYLAGKAREKGAKGYLYRNVTDPGAIKNCITSVYEGKNCFNEK